VGATDEEEVERTGVHPDRHPQPDLPGVGDEAAAVAQGGSHRERCRRRTPLVLVAVVEQQQRVAAELEERSVVLVRVGEQPVEAGRDDVGHALRPGLAEPRQSLGELREAGDVDEDHRSVDATVERIDIGGRRPLAHDPRYVRLERAGPVHLRHPRRPTATGAG
jgi:hypothetical protein